MMWGLRNVGQDAERGIGKIQTARTLDEINAGIRKGFRPLVKPVVPSPEIRTKIILVKSRFGKLREVADYRAIEGGGEIVTTIWHYPHDFDCPYAAYLLPRSLKPGERVFLEDLIEDFVGGMWNQGDRWRLESAEAIWNGEDFEIDAEDVQHPTMIG